MADAAYDVIIIGGGHNGLSLALYLLNSGMTVGVFEEKNEIGGGCDTMELAAPGFWGNLHSWGHMHIMGAEENFPAYHDFEIEKKYGVRYVSVVGPDGTMGTAFPDGTCVTAYDTRDPEGAIKTYRELSRFSERDADTLVRLHTFMHGPEKELLLKFLYSPPVPLGQRTALQDFAEAIGLSEMDYHYYMSMSPLQILDELLESKHLKCSMINAMWGIAFPPDAFGTGFVSLCMHLIMEPNRKWHCVGGSHNLAHGMHRALHDLGGKSFTLSEVEKVIIENGTAKGVRLLDGTEIEARKAVVSAVDAAQTMLRFIGREHLDPRTVRRIENLRYGYEALIWPQIALHEPPKYNAASFNPDIADAAVVTLGPPDADPYAFYRAFCELEQGRFPEGWWPMVNWVDSLYDPTQAPKGKYFSSGQIYAPRASAFSEKEWLEWKRKGPAEWMKRWQQYASNMTMDNVIAFDFFTPWDTAQRLKSMREGGWILAGLVPSQIYRFRPIPELSDYRTPIKNLYMCANCMPTVPTGVTGIPGYCCYKVMAEDYGLEKIWEKKGRSY